MARRPRLHVPGGFYHVTLRGNHRQPIFFAEDDRTLLGEVVAEAAGKLAARIHAYCWMTNHLHLLVQIAVAPLGQLMLRIASRYARRVQASLRTTGHLFERRYHAVLVDADDYLLTLVRYIHRNPVRAGMVRDPVDYPWSSHRVYLGLRDAPWLQTAFALQMLGNTRGEAIRRYQSLMTGDEETRWGEGTLKPHPDQVDILGSDDFIARILGETWTPGMHRSLDDIVRECSKRFRIPPDALGSASRARYLAPARAWIGHRAVAEQVASVSEVARRLNRSEAAVRQLMARHPDPDCADRQHNFETSTRHR